MSLKAYKNKRYHSRKDAMSIIPRVSVGKVPKREQTLKMRHGFRRHIASTRLIDFAENPYVCTQGYGHDARNTKSNNKSPNGALISSVGQGKRSEPPPYEKRRIQVAPRRKRAYSVTFPRRNGTKILPFPFFLSRSFRALFLLLIFVGLRSRCSLHPTLTNFAPLARE